MTTTTGKDQTILRDLGEGLVLRRSTLADTEALVAFISFVHGRQDTGAPDDRAGVWVRDLMTRPHPTFETGDFTIVEDTRTGKIVSCLNLIPQTWTYGGIPFKVGRPELVGTQPEYRNRGLVRLQFEVIHQWCLERDYKVQAITGIPYYYRLFGYEMCLNLGGGRTGYLPQVPRLKEGESEPYLIRPATEADIPFISQLYNLSCQRSIVSCVWDEALWRCELTGKSADNVNRQEIRIITSPEGEPVGFLTHPPYRWGPVQGVTWYELKAGLSYAAVTPSVIRYLVATGEAASTEHDPEPFGGFSFGLGANHPVFKTLLNRLPRENWPYAWYIRLPDIPGFLRLIAPVLEKRLVDSPFAGHSGEIRLTFYRDGVRMVFEKGKLTTAEPYKPSPAGHGNAAFPELTFLRLLFGYNSLDDLRPVFADVWTDSPEMWALLTCLFPKQPSTVWAVA